MPLLSQLPASSHRPLASRLRSPSQTHATTSPRDHQPWKITPCGRTGRRSNNPRRSTSIVVVPELSVTVRAHGGDTSHATPDYIFYFSIPFRMNTMSTIGGSDAYHGVSFRLTREVERAKLLSPTRDRRGGGPSLLGRDGPSLRLLRGPVPIKNYTTEIAEERTVGEITGLLAAKGARSVSIAYDEESRPDAISFVILLSGFPIPFRLPCNFEGVFKYMARGYTNHSARRRFEDDPWSKRQARRIAWRIIKDWVAAQMALIEAEQATMAQVFLPYAIPDQKSKLTMFDKFLETVANQKQLVEGKSA